MIKLLAIMVIFMMASTSNAAQLALVIDDFGYREHNEEQVISFSPEITIAVLPNSPNAAHIATLAYEHGNDVIIHLPMAPMGKQALEVDTLTPAMEQAEIDRIVKEAIEKVPYAIGVNNHMGSLMTSNLAAMQSVMKSLSHYSLFFLDSRTIGSSKGIIAANKYRIPSVGRDVFLDDSQDEQDVARQFDLAIKLARQHGSAVAIGHPYGSTVKVLKEKLNQLPDDIELVRVKSLTTPAKKVNLSDMMEKYKIRFEQTLFEMMIFKQSLTIESGKTAD